MILTYLRRRLARRGGVKRIAGTIYDDVRQAMKSRLTHVCRNLVGRLIHCLTGG